MGTLQGRPCISAEPFAHFLHSKLGSSLLPRWPQPTQIAQSQNAAAQQRAVTACATVLERSALLESTLSVRNLAESIRQRQQSAAEVTKHYFQRIDSLDPGIRSFLALNKEAALAAAQAIDDKIASGESVGPLAGVPISIKDNILTQGIETTAASSILKGGLYAIHRQQSAVSWPSMQPDFWH